MNKIFKIIMLSICSLAALSYPKSFSLSIDLLCAIETGNVDRVNNLLQDEKNLEPDDLGRTALMYASTCKHACIEEILCRLMKNKNSFKTKLDIEGYNAINYAEKYENNRAIDFLKRKGLGISDRGDKYRYSRFIEKTETWKKEIQSLCYSDIEKCIVSQEKNKDIQHPGLKHRNTGLEKPEDENTEIEFKNILDYLDDSEKDISVLDHHTKEICEKSRNLLKNPNYSSLYYAKFYAYFRTQFYLMDHEMALNCLNLLKNQIDILKVTGGKIDNKSLSEELYPDYAFYYSQAIICLIILQNSKKLPENINIHRIAKDFALNKVISKNPFEYITLKKSIDQNYNSGIFGCIINPIWDLFYVMKETLYGVQNTVENVNTEILHPAHECINTCENTIKQVGDQTTTTIKQLEVQTIASIKEISAGVIKVLDPLGRLIGAYADAKESKNTLDNVAGWIGTAISIAGKAGLVLPSVI